MSPDLAHGDSAAPNRGPRALREPLSECHSINSNVECVAPAQGTCDTCSHTLEASVFHEGVYLADQSAVGVEPAQIDLEVSPTNIIQPSTEPA